MVVGKSGDPVRKIEDFFPYSEAQINYLVNCSKRYRYVYVETPKVACSTIKRALQILEVDGDESRLNANVHDRKKSPLLNPNKMGVAPGNLLEGDEFFRFSFVRNPYSRVLSAYLDKIVGNQWERARLLPALGFGVDRNVSLYEFLEAIKDVPHAEKDIHWTPQSYILQRHAVQYHYIGRFENFNGGFTRVLQKISPAWAERLFKVRADGHRTNAGSKIAEYIGSRERDLILEIFENDFEVFRYSLDPHFADVC